MIRSLLCLFFTLLGLAAAAAASRAAEASILGKAPTLVMPLAPQLESADYKVATLAMPWSSLREYDAGYPQALAEIGAAAQSLRDKGAKRIVVAGQSFGSSGALAYAASGCAVDAIVVLSPGHTPERGQVRKALERSVDKARTMRAAAREEQVPGGAGGPPERGRRHRAGAGRPAASVVTQGSITCCGARQPVPQHPMLNLSRRRARQL